MRKDISEINIIAKMVDKLNMELLQTKSCNTRTRRFVKVVKQGVERNKQKLHTVISQLQEFAAVAVEADYHLLQIGIRKSDGQQLHK